jgi:hypothetical protein
MGKPAEMLQMFIGIYSSLALVERLLNASILTLTTDRDKDGGLCQADCTGTQGRSR